MRIYRLLIMSGYVMGWAFDWTVAGLGSSPGPTVLVIDCPRILVGNVLGFTSSINIVPTTLASPSAV